MTSSTQVAGAYKNVLGLVNVLSFQNTTDSEKEDQRNKDVMQ